MKTDHLKIKELTEEFISESIKNENPAGLCFATSYPLKIYLLIKNVRSILKVGKVPKATLDDPDFKYDHFWLEIDEEGTILDSTIIQFSGDLKMPIYIGKLEDYDITKQYIKSEDLTKNWFPQVYYSWSTPFVDRTYPLNEFTKRNIIYQIRLATILHLEMNKLTNPDERIKKCYQNYIKPIFIFLQDWQNGNTDIEIDKKQMHPNFESLLSEALTM